MNENHQAHYYATLTWLSEEGDDMTFPSPKEPFRVECIITSRKSLDLDALINYTDKILYYEGKAYNAKIHFRALMDNVRERNNLGKKTEFVLLDGYKILGICRDVMIVKSENETLDIK